MTTPRSVKLQKYIRFAVNQRVNVVGHNRLDVGWRALDHHVCVDLSVRPFNQPLRCALTLEIDRFLGIAAREQFDRWIPTNIVLCSNVHFLVCIDFGNDE